MFYRMKPENISCEVNIFPMENRGLFFNQTSDDILQNCVIVDKQGIHERRSVDNQYWGSQIRIPIVKFFHKRDSYTILKICEI